MAGHPACPRCYCEEDVVRPWRGFRAVRGIWLCGAAFILLFSPILFSDLLLMIPLSTIFLLAGGPALACAAQAPTCVRCGLERPHPGWHETPCRPVRLVDGTPRSALRESPSAPKESEEVSGLHDLSGLNDDQRPP
jgi:hypothetical protein